MRLQAFQFELIPSEQQRRSLQCFAGACRFVFNKALEVQKRRFEGGDKYLGYPALCRLLTTWRHDPDTPWLKEAPTHPLQQALKNLDRAFANFFAKRAGFPCFKKKGRRESFHYPDPQQIKLEQGNKRLFLPKLGWLRYRNSRQVLGTVRNITVSLRAGHWSVSIQTARMDEPVTAIGSPVGVDSTLVARRLGDLRWITCAAPSYLDEKGIPEELEDLRRHRAVHYFSSATRRDGELHFVEGGDSVTVPVPGTVAVNETGLYIKLGLDGVGLMQLAEILVADHLRSGKLVEVLPNMRPAPVPISLVYPHHRFLSPAMRAFADWTAELFSNVG
jgi:hypothetical protein